MAIEKFEQLNILEVQE